MQCQVVEKRGDGRERRRKTEVEQVTAVLSGKHAKGRESKGTRTALALLPVSTFVPHGMRPAGSLRSGLPGWGEQEVGIE
jgi:hypothetical protein